MINLGLMMLITSLLAIGAYIGYVRGSDMAGTDSTVGALAAPGATSNGIGVRLMARLGEPIGFGFVGIIGGLVTGYYWNAIRWRRSDD